MATFGETLKRERERRKISLREVSEATKIGLRYLEAMEGGQFDQLPGGVFNKGFIRAYAKFIGLDGEALVTSYLEARGPQPEPAIFLPDPVGAPPKDPAPSAPAGVGPAAPAVGAPPRWLVPALVVMGIVIVAAVGLWMILGRGDRRERVDTPSATAPKRRAAAGKPAPAGSSATGAATAPGANSPGPAGTAGAALSPLASSSDPVFAPGAIASRTGESAAGFFPLVSGAPGTMTPPKNVAPTRPPRAAPLVAAFSVWRTTYLEVWCDGVQRLGRDVAAGETEQISCDGEIRVSSSNAGVVAMRIDGNDCLPMGEVDEPLSELTVSRSNAAEICPPPGKER